MRVRACMRACVERACLRGACVRACVRAYLSNSGREMQIVSKKELRKFFTVGNCKDYLVKGSFTIIDIYESVHSVR